MKLIDGKKNKSYKLESITLDTAVKRRLEILGMTVGTRLDILEKKGRRAIIIKCRSSRFAIGGNFAAGMEVTPWTDR